MNILEVDKLTKRYGSEIAVSNLFFFIGRGDFDGLNRTERSRQNDDFVDTCRIIEADKRNG
nr:hypothetical protein [Planococcus glaciei]